MSKPHQPKKKVKKLDSKNQVRKWLKDILEMVEDKDFPARRNITDYVELIISHLKPEWKKEMEEFCQKYYNKIDIK
tara:strand:- start:725 stop:952 length:228 start_codon:yes stop_codon:yes gene_type:complete